jgi:DNA-binding MarR family transcriptional regulator
MVPQDNDADVDRVADSLRDLYLRSHRVMDRLMSAHGASFARTKLLLLIARQGPVRSIDLASYFGYAPRTVTEAIDGLERDGLVRRDPDPDDRRAKRISLTGTGLVAVESAEAARREFVDGVFGVLDPAERAEMVRLIGRLNDRLAELGG